MLTIAPLPTAAPDRRRRFAGLLSALLSLSACGGGSESSVMPGAPGGVTAITAPAVSASSIPQATGVATPGIGTVQTPSAMPMPITGVGSIPTSDSQPIAQLTGTMVPVTVNFVMPSSVAQSSGLRRAMSLQSRTQRGLQYVSTSHVSIKVVVTPSGGGSSTYTGTCTTGSCTASFTANPGPNTLAFSLTDGAAGTGNVLSSYSTLVIVQPIGINALNFTANPVVDHVSLTLATPTVNAGTATDVPLTVNAMDKDGNAIIGSSQYVDVNGNTVSLLLNVTNTQAGGRGAVGIRGPLRITASGQDAIVAHYDGNWLDHATISVTSTSSAVTISSGTTLTTVPYAVEYPIGSTSNGGIIVGPDGNIWFTQTNGYIGKISVNGTNYNQYSCGACYPDYIATGVDGNLWFTDDSFTGHIEKITTSGFITSVAGGYYPQFIIRGIDGNLWYSYDGGVGKISTSGNNQTYFKNNPGFGDGIAFGLDGNLWYLNSGSAPPSIGNVTIAGQYLNSYSVPGIAHYGNQSIISGPDGNMWFANASQSLIEKSTLGGMITSYSTPSGAPNGIVAEPDGNIWFGEDGSCIGRITTDGSSLKEFRASDGIASGASPVGLTVGPDGNIWFVQNGQNRIGKFVF